MIRVSTIIMQVYKIIGRFFIASLPPSLSFLLYKPTSQQLFSNFILPNIGSLFIKQALNYVSFADWKRAIFTTFKNN